MEIQAHYQTFVYIFLVILIGFLINVNTQDFTFTYNEKSVNNFTRKFFVKTIDSLSDGTVIVRIMKEKNKDDQNQTTYYEPKLLLRFILPNGSVTEINNVIEKNNGSVTEINIPYYNFNYPSYALGSNGYKSDDKFNPLDSYPLFDNYILIVYTNASDWNNNTTFVDQGMIIDWTGTKKSDIKFGESYIDRNSTLMPNQATFAMNSDRTKGFLRFSPIRGSNDAEWKQYFVNYTGHLSLIGSGIISNFFSNRDHSDANYTIFSTTNNDYVI
ncbi:21987_t:CDS:2, partial [Cetraspora pellucida]